MEKISEMIRRLCPEGVEKVLLKELSEIGTGSCNRQDAIDNGAYPFFVRSKEILRSGTFEFEEEAILIPGEGGIGDIFHYYNGKYALHQRTYRIHVIYESLSTKYLYYYMFSSFKGYILRKAVASTATSIRKPMIENFEIPLPPLPIQLEIVRILDSFTSMITNLETELASRQKQYEHYRNKLLTFDENDESVEWKMLKEFASIYDGTHQTPTYIDEGIPFVSVENIGDIYNSHKFISRGDYEKYKIKPQIGDVFMTRIGSIGICAIFDKQLDVAYYVSLALLRPNKDIVTSGYLKYIIESDIGSRELRKKTLVHAVPIKVNKEDIGKILLPIPSIHRQCEIVSTLDTFESLITNLKQEIAARKKQYEYYREQLLIFE